MSERTCLNCGAPLTTKRQIKHCSAECRLEHHRGHTVRLYQRDPEYRKRQNARQKAWYRIVKTGPGKQPCQVCGDPNATMHHDDYDKPYEIAWYCRPHHDQADRERRSA